MERKTLKWIIYFWGAVSLFVFFAIRFQPVFNGLLKEEVVENYWDKTTYGEMYYFSMIRSFREAGLPPAQRKFELSSKHPSLDECKILTFGDSFFEFSRLKQFPERLSDDFDLPVHYVNEDFPLKYIEKANYQETIPKIVIYERTERYIPVSFEEIHMLHAGAGVVPSSRLGFLTALREKVFYDSSEELYGVMLKRSYVTTTLYSTFATLKFNWFGYISSLTPIYSVNGHNSWLFYHDQVNDEKTSFYYSHTPSEIDSICDHMADLAQKLESEYNLYLLYLPMPAKYTMYHGVVNNDQYNGFLPELYKGLEKRGVRYVNLFDDFRNHPDTLYFRTDSHWNQTGLNLAYSKTIAYIRSDSVLNSILSSKDSEE